MTRLLLLSLLFLFGCADKNISSYKASDRKMWISLSGGESFEIRVFPQTAGLKEVLAKGEYITNADTLYLMYDSFSHPNYLVEKEFLELDDSTGEEKWVTRRIFDESGIIELCNFPTLLFWEGESLKAIVGGESVLIKLVSEDFHY